MKMIRILLILTAAASLFAAPAARARNDQNINDQNIPAVVRVDPIPPVHKNLNVIAPGQPDQGERPSQAQRRTLGYIGPAQPDYGISTKLQSLGIEEPPAEILPPHLPDLSELLKTDTAVVDEIIDPLRIKLKDGRIVQLTGLDIPDLVQEDPGNISILGFDFLERLLKNKKVTLYQSQDKDKGRINRMGHHLAHLVAADKDIWVQGALLTAGLARVQPSARNPELAAAMIAIEDGARTAQRGLWRGGRYPILTPENAETGLASWAVVEGRIRAVATAQNMLYLNFGLDWRKDFTITMSAPVRRAVGKSLGDPMGWSGRTVRVRGWIESRNGPSIGLLGPEWISLLPAEGKADKVAPDANN